MARHSFRRIRNFFEVVEAARECSVALEFGGRPSHRALKVVGIDADAFERIRRR